MASGVFHTVLVVGNNPEELLKKYSADLKVDKYVKYKRSDAKKILQKTLKLYKAILDSDNCSFIPKDQVKRLYYKYLNMDDFEFYKEITKGCIFMDDSLDAYTDENPDAKYAYCNLDFTNNKFSLPFILNDGNETYQAKKSDIAWEKIHMANTFPYERAWEMVVDGDEPNNDDEKNIYENMKHNFFYFQNFDDKEEYVRHSCSFWEYAYLDENGWQEITNDISDKEWVANYYEKYIEPLPDDALLTIFEYRQNY